MYGRECECVGGRVRMCGQESVWVGECECVDRRVCWRESGCVGG